MCRNGGYLDVGTNFFLRHESTIQRGETIGGRFGCCDEMTMAAFLHRIPKGKKGSYKPIVEIRSVHKSWGCRLLRTEVHHDKYRKSPVS